MKLLRLVNFFTVVTLAFLSLEGCKESHNKSVQKSEFESLLGVWERSGYGDVLLIEPDQAVWYQYTRAGCVAADEMDHAGLARLITDIEVLTASSFRATSPLNPAFPILFDRRESLPKSCMSITSSTPVEVFDFLWHSFNDYYVFFAERNIDWLSRYDAFRHRVDDSIDSHALWQLLTELLSGIDDGHVNLISKDDTYSPALPRGIVKTLQQAFEEQNEYDDFGVYAGTNISRYMDILLTRYLDEGSVRQDGEIFWGTIQNEIGYLHVQGMGGFSNTDGATAMDDVNAVKAIMKRVVNDLAGTSAMIIDVRLNGGGDDGVAMGIANHFTDTRRLAVQRTARSYAGEEPTQALYMEPVDAPYLKPVVIIAGPNTASAAEVFVLAMRNLTQVTLVGESTNGTFSDMLSKTLPNGWRVTLSNQIYRDPNGVNYEVTGIPPQVEVSVFLMRDLEIGANAALDKALEILGYNAVQQ